MAKVLIYFRTENHIWDHMLYSKNLAPIKFDGIDSGLALLSKQGQRDETHLSIITVAPSLEYPTHKEFEKGSHLRNGKWGKTGNVDHGTTQDMEESFPHVLYSFSLIYVNERWKAVLTLEADIASCLAKELHRSYSYRRRFLRYVHHNIGFHISGCANSESDEMVDIYPCDNEVRMDYIVELWVKYCSQRIDYSW